LRLAHIFCYSVRSQKIFCLRDAFLGTHVLETRAPGPRVLGTPPS
jgi:hypothetical protein